MDVHISEMTAEVRAVDDRTLVSPEVLDQVVRHVMRLLEERDRDEQRSRADRQFRDSVREDDSWGAERW